MKKDCSNCICRRCKTDECFVSMCNGACVEPEYYEKAIEQCHVEECVQFIPMDEIT